MKESGNLMLETARHTLYALNLFSVCFYNFKYWLLIKYLAVKNIADYGNNDNKFSSWYSSLFLEIEKMALFWCLYC